jgi:hypothetical protein
VLRAMPEAGVRGGAADGDVLRRGLASTANVQLASVLLGYEEHYTGAKQKGLAAAAAQFPDDIDDVDADTPPLLAGELEL